MGFVSNLICYIDTGNKDSTFPIDLAKWTYTPILRRFRSGAFLPCKGSKCC